MHPFIAIGLAAISGLVVGIKLQGTHARWLCIGALTLALICFVAYAGLTNYAREIESLSLRRVAQASATGSWIGLYVAAGACGPALSRQIGVSIAISVLSAVLASVVGMPILFGLACGLAEECL
jgi:hypothetical protein